MASLNRVLLIGNLGQDPEMRFTQSQTPVTSFSIATTETRTVDGQKQDQTEWHRIVVWGKQAENCKKYLAKGRTVFIEGRLQTRSWDDKATGAKRYTTEIVAQNVKFMGGGRGASQGYGDQASAGGSNGSHANEPAAYGGGAGVSAGFDGDAGGGSNFGGPETPSMDEIPF